jgi:hypothetical protein
MLYQEKISSARTLALFLALYMLFCLLLLWHLQVVGLDVLTGILLFFSIVFLFYTINYRTLYIQITTSSVILKFGVLSWTVPVENIAACHLDELPTLKRMGGAGIHFMTVRGCYRASFNFLEYPRVIIILKRNRGPVQAISFSTRQPEEIIQLIQTILNPKP